MGGHNWTERRHSLNWDGITVLAQRQRVTTLLARSPQPSTQCCILAATSVISGMRHRVFLLGLTTSALTPSTTRQTLVRLLLS